MKIKFTIELEDNQHLLFLDVLVYKKEDNCPGPTNYKKNTDKNPYTNATSNEHPAKVKMLIETAR